MNNQKWMRTSFLLWSIVPFLAATMRAEGQILFEDVTVDAGWVYVGESWGGSWGDLNGDSLPDLFANHHRNLASIYLNQGDGTFDDVALHVNTWTTPEGALIDMHGGSWADFDNDGDLDLYVSAGRADDNQFFVNDEGVLVDRTAELDPLIPQLRARQPIWFDFSGDGLLDFFMASENMVPLFEQTNAGFVNRTAQASLACERSQIGMLAGLTGGGALEALCIGSTFVRNAYEYPGLPFTRVTPSLPKAGSVLDVATEDFDGDLNTDVFVVRGGRRLSGAIQVGNSQAEIQLITQGGHSKRARFETSGDITVTVSTSGWNMGPGDIFVGAGGRRPPDPTTDFRSVSFVLEQADSATHGIAPHSPSQNRGIYIGYDTSTGAWEVINSPGGQYTYIYVSAVSSAPVSNVLASNLENDDGPFVPQLFLKAGGNFTDATTASGLRESIRCVSVGAGDFDNDADVDLFLACRGAIENIPNLLYENQGNGTFTPIPQAGGGAGPTGFGSGESESVVVGDYDVDGFLDLYVSNGLQMAPVGEGGPDLLFRNVSANGNHWLELDLEGTASNLGGTGSNRDGIGARIFVTTAGGITQLREQDGGYHRWSQDSQIIHFGLGGATEADIRVEWPSGGPPDIFTDVAADKLYRVVENGAIEVVEPGIVPPEEARLSIDDIEIAENESSAIFTVRLSGAVSNEVSVDYASADGTATAPDDYAAVAGTLTFAPGETTSEIIVPIVDDGDSEGEEQFSITLSNPVMATLSDASGRATIDDDEGPPCGSPTYNPATEQLILIFQDCDTGLWSLRTTGGGSGVRFRGSLVSNQAFSDVTPVSVENNDTLESTANPPEIVFSLGVGGSGQDGFDFGVATDAPVCVNLDAPSNRMVLIGTGRTAVSPPFDLGTLGACEDSPPPPALSLGDVGASESDATLSMVVNLSPQSNQEVTVDYATVDASATAGEDYEAVNGSLTFPIGVTQQTVDIPLLDDGAAEGSETFTLVLSNAVGAILSDAEGTATLIDDESPPCGLPSFDPASEQGVFVGQDCASDDWLVRVSPGGRGVRFEGVATATEPYGRVTGFSIESSDVLAVEDGGTAIRYLLSVGNSGQDGFNFRLADTADVCFDVAQPAGAQIFVGPDRQPATAPFDLRTLASCTPPDAPSSSCGMADYDPASEQEIFVGQDCQSGLWQARFTAGGQGVRYDGRVQASAPFSEVTGFSIEASDELDFSSNTSEIVYSLAVGNTGQDGMNFRFPATAEVCFGAGAPAGSTALVGPDRNRITMPFDLTTLSPCGP